MLLPFGPLKAFNLVMDRSTGNSKVRCARCARYARCAARTRAWALRRRAPRGRRRPALAPLCSGASAGPTQLLRTAPAHAPQIPGLGPVPVFHLPCRSELAHTCPRLPRDEAAPPLLAPLPLQGYAFCEYLDVGMTDAVIQALNGKPIGNKFLTGGLTGRGRPGGRGRAEAGGARVGRVRALGRAGRAGPRAGGQGTKAAVGGGWECWACGLGSHAALRRAACRRRKLLTRPLARLPRALVPAVKRALSPSPF